MAKPLLDVAGFGVNGFGLDAVDRLALNIDGGKANPPEVGGLVPVDGTLALGIAKEAPGAAMGAERVPLGTALVPLDAANCPVEPPGNEDAPGRPLGIA